MDRQRMEECLAQVVAYQASGKRAKDWAAEQGVPMRMLASWCAHAKRWQARLDGVSEPVAVRPSGFVAARVASAVPAGSVRIELQAGATPVALHWPLTGARELAAWLREMSR